MANVNRLALNVGKTNFVIFRGKKKVYHNVILILRATSGPDSCYDKKIYSCNVFPIKPHIHESEMFSDMNNTYVVT